MTTKDLVKEYLEEYMGYSDVRITEFNSFDIKFNSSDGWMSKRLDLNYITWVFNKLNKK